MMLSLTVSCVTPRATGLRCPALGGLNLKRRHLSEEQRAMVAGRLANLEEGRPEKTAPIGAVSQSDAAELLNVSRRSVQRACVVLENGAPELIAAVDAGQVSVSAAAEVATLPEDEQREVVARGEKEILTRAKEIRAAKAVRDDYATACGLTRSRVGKKCRCTKMDCTTLLVKGTSGHLKHRSGGMSFSSMLQHNDLRRLTSRDG